MYIQPRQEGEEAPIAIPRNYSGNAFQRAPIQPEPPPQPPTEPPAPPMPEPAPEPPPPEPAEESVRTGAFFEEKEKGRGGLRGRFPFLSSLLPPCRGEYKKGGVLPEWALIGAVILLFLWEDEENDILPFLLLLLLWD